MTKIKPFAAVVYNQKKIEDLSKVVCPPYDIISATQQEHYHETSPYNFIHILLGKDLPGENKYKRAAAYFKDWLKEGVFIRENQPAIYFYLQEYKLRGEKRFRLGFIALLGLPDKECSVFAHEHTRLGPKEDRLKLIREVKANLSPIFVVVADKKRIIQRIHDERLHERDAFIEITDKSEVTHRLWRITSPKVLDEITRGMSQENIFIADGHHRFEVACAYREEMRNSSGPLTGDEPFNYIMSYFTHSDPRGLSILPVNRLLNVGAEFDLKEMLKQAADYFDLEEVKDKGKFFFLLEKAGLAEHAVGMYKDRRYWLLRLKNIKILDKMIADKPKSYRTLDVSVLNHIVFKEIFKIDPDDKDSFAFSQDADEFIAAVDNDDKLIAFFLNPVNMRQIMDVALSGNRMPPKSTYFYPKVLSGLLINKF